MRLIMDLHTHTTASGHAYSTLTENIMAAKKNGLKILGVSDHAPMMPGSTHSFHFGNLRIIPEYVEGIRVLKGVELNILNEAGEVDLGGKDVETLDYGIASIHVPCFSDLGRDGNTLATINTMKNPLVKIIGHPDDGRFPLDYEKLVKAAKEHHVLLEVNNSSLKPTSYRENAADNYKIMLKLCAEYGVSIIFGSDAHFTSDIGNFEKAMAFCEEIGFPKELIVNTSEEKLMSFLK